MNTNITPSKIVNHVRSMNFSHAFNPYSQTCDIHDHSDSSLQRANLLRDMLEAASDVEIDAVWIGRDLGHRGGRRTGLALTDDLNFDQHISRWGLQYQRPTLGLPIKERTASVIWDMLQGIKENVFLWNVFPLHPFVDGNSFTNRTHNSGERQAGIFILNMLIDFLNPRKIVAIGNDAANAASCFSEKTEVFHVRHPSYGGQSEFCEQIELLYEVKSSIKQQFLF